MKTIYLIALFGLLFSAPTRAQDYSLQQLEAAFLQNNFILLASRLQISQAEAHIVQEKLWDNPTLSISEVNLWSNRTSEQYPPLFGNYGRTQQVSVELEQLIETAGKRKKRVAIRQLERDSKSIDYEELMRELRKDLREAYYELYIAQRDLANLAETLQIFKNLSQTYQRQAQAQNVSRADWLRVQAELVTLEKEELDLQRDMLEALAVLQALTNLTDLEPSKLTFEKLPQQLQRTVPLSIRQLALENNLGIRRQDNQLRVADRELELELANRKPDLTVQMNYDRGGNIMQDFVGVGLSLDLPLLNRNKGNIKVAQFQIREEQAQRDGMLLELETKLSSLTAQIGRYQQALQRWSDLDTEAERRMLESYHKNMLSRQITLLEFIDFTQAWRASHQAMLETQKNYLNTYEELQFVVGNDF